MGIALQNSARSGLTKAALLLAVAITGVACTATAPKPKAAVSHIEVDESVGFTITEDAKIAEAVRNDYDEAMLLLQQEQLAEGIAILERVVQAAPDLSAPRIDLGVAYHRAGNLEAAEKSLLAALETSPQHPVAHNELGILYRKTGRFAQARRSYKAALAVYPNYHYARRNLAVLCDLYLGDLDCALDNYVAYMTTVPDDNEASMWIAARHRH